MLYKYETHLHTAEVSACAVSSGAEMVRAYKAAGYAGIVVTDHFRNEHLNLRWKNKIRQYVEGFENARAEGIKCGLDVFFGLEMTVYGDDFLVYNIDSDFLLSNPDMFKIPIEELFGLIRKSGGIVIHAHPFREAWYIEKSPSPRPYLVDGLEVNNGASDNKENHNEKAWELARRFPQLIRTSGSDIHDARGAGIAGMAFEYKIDSIAHFTGALRAGDGYLIIDGAVEDTL